MIDGLDLCTTAAAFTSSMERANTLAFRFVPKKHGFGSGQKRNLAALGLEEVAGFLGKLFLAFLDLPIQPDKHTMLIASR
jgi:hypothetical protein